MVSENNGQNDGTSATLGQFLKQNIQYCEHCNEKNDMKKLKVVIGDIFNPVITQIET